MPSKHFTSETARKAALASAKVRARKRAEKAAREERDRERVKRAFAAESNGEDYIQIRVARIRAQLDRFDELLLTETDPQKAQWLATVTAKLAEQERILSGRPNPGNLRPSAPSRRSPATAPLVPE